MMILMIVVVMVLGGSLFFSSGNVQVLSMGEERREKRKLYLQHP